MVHGSQSAQSSQPAASLLCQYVAPYSHLVEMPWLSPIVFEIFSTIAGLTGLGLQICNVYKTSWWLSYSDTDLPLNFKKMDMQIVFLAILVVLRRFFAFLCRVSVDLIRKHNRGFFTQSVLIAAVIPVALFIILVIFTLFNLSQEYPAEEFGYLLFPVVTYVVLFGFKLQPVYSSGVCCPHELGQSVVHVCSSVPSLCRAECSDLATDFNTRLNHMFFNSAVTAYYTTVIPLLFTGNEIIFIGPFWAINVVVLSFLTQLMLYSTFYLPCRYLDILQRCAAHLGQWKRLDSPIPANHWLEAQLWAGGSFVRHSGKVYRAICPFNAAIPGCNLHINFHKRFSSPVRFYDVLVACSLFTLAYSLFVLVFYAPEWHQSIGVGLLTLADGASSFYLVRSRFVLMWTQGKKEMSTNFATRKD